MRVLHTAGSREIDRIATQEYAIPSMVLMENAALGLLDALTESFPRADRILILCGPGNNGGDGLALARHLGLRGFVVHVLLIGDVELSGDAGLQETICRRQGLSIERVSEAAALPWSVDEWDLIVDAIFGVGLSRPLEGLYEATVEWLDEVELPILSVDLPSGLTGDASHPIGPHVSADVTVTFETPKPAHVLPPACNAAGELVVADLGIPPAIADSIDGDLHLVTAEAAAALLPPRPAAAHKGDFGHVLVVAGSEGMGGAAILASRGAIRIGAGLVTCAVPESVLPTVDSASLESMTLALPAAAAGGFAPDAVVAVISAASTRQVVALGPGLGPSEEAAEFAREVIAGVERPLVVDASALRAVAGETGRLGARQVSTIVTPHAGELASLLDVTIDEVSRDRVAAARRAAEATGAIVVLKGQATLVVDTEGEVWINPTGNPGLATGGTGDVLTGIISGLWAQGLKAAEAARLGVFIHGLAGDLAAAEFGERSLAAADLLPMLPRAFRELEA